MDTTPITGADAASPATAAAAAARVKVRQLAEQFEAMLLTQMLSQMRQSMLSEDDSQDGDGGFGLGSKTMTDTIDSELAQALSHSSRLGVADFIVRAFDRQSQVSGAPAVTPQPASPAVITAPDVSVVPLPALPLPSGSVSSAFGWREDPITGRQSFHSGTDVRMAYGQDVRVAADGRVAFVGTQGGYGLTVVVDHGRGVETRYAHLSSTPVRQGDPVDSGQVIAQSGNSGRSTGPHLHFEVLDNGQAVDPRLTAGILTASNGTE